MTAAQTTGTALASFDDILKAAALMTDGKPLRAAVIFPHQADVIRSCRMAVDAGLIAPVFVGDRDKQRQAEREAGIVLSPAETVAAEYIDEAVQIAARMAAAKEIDLVVRGGAPVSEFIRLLAGEGGLLVNKGSTAGHVAFIKPEKYHKLLAITDVAVHPEPDLKTKIGLTENLVAACRKAGIDRPRVAVLAAVEVVYPQMPATLEAAVLSKMGERGQIKGAFVDGPLSFDCAVDPSAAESKGIRTSEVAGQADAMLMPNMETGHGVYKAMALYGRAKLGGAIYGTRVPVALPSTSDTAETAFHSIAVACLLA